MFPHWIIDGFLPEYLLDGILAEWPGMESMEYKECRTSVKAHLSDWARMGPVTTQTLQFLNSDPMLAFLEHMTGIPDLIPDESLSGGGLHHIPPGGFLNIHADFNWHGGLQAVRRLNLLLYLNRNWTANGDLILCDTSGRPFKKIAPVYNRCVVFETTDTSYHGHPEPLTGNVPRKSLALYYYVRQPKPDYVHSTLYAS